MITLRINLSKIDKNRLFKGEKGTYLNVVLIETPNSQYSDYMVKQQVSKEEREKGIEIIIGDGKNFVKTEHRTNEAPPPNEPDDDSLPF